MRYRRSGEGMDLHSMHAHLFEQLRHACARHSDVCCIGCASAGATSHGESVREQEGHGSAKAAVDGARRSRGRRQGLCHDSKRACERVDEGSEAKSRK